MQTVLARVSKFGLQYEGDKTLDDKGKQKWYNLSKYEEGLTLAGFSKGDTVNLELNSKGFVTKLEKVSGAAQAPSTLASTPSEHHPAAGFDAAKANARNNETELRITRSSSVKTAFGEPFRVFASVEGASLEDAVNLSLQLSERLANYILTGSSTVVQTPPKES